MDNDTQQDDGIDYAPYQEIFDMFEARDDAWTEHTDKISKKMPNVTAAIEELLNDCEIAWYNIEYDDGLLMFTCTVGFEPGDDLSFLSQLDKSVLEETEPATRRIHMGVPMLKCLVEKEEMKKFILESAQQRHKKFDMDELTEEQKRQLSFFSDTGVAQ